MLFKAPVLSAIAEGQVTLAFRRWRRLAKAWRLAIAYRRAVRLFLQRGALGANPHA